jgi:hypothetical protein
MPKPCQLLKRALGINEKARGPDHLDVATSLSRQHRPQTDVPLP